ncbi:MAG: alkaline phosphatase family protein [Acidobacteriota bacterium]
MRALRRPALAAVLVAAALLPEGADARPPARRTENVVLIVSDGLRWQEVFRGAEEDLSNEQCGSIPNVEEFRREFWRDTPEERRRALLPFFWDVIAARGQLFGNQTEGSLAHDTNGRDFSYPGYNEMLAGVPDPRIDSNDPVPNRNVTVFEWLNRQPRLAGRVAAYGTWSVFDAIFNAKRSGLKVCAGWRPAKACLAPPVPETLRRLFETTTPYWTQNVWDSFLQAAVLDEVTRRRPRVLFVGYGETDEWAHLGRYGRVLAAAHRVDAFIAELWDTMQAIPQYRGKTTFLVAADHGRGQGLEDWKDHGRDAPGASEIWIAVLGPDTPALGERRTAPPVILGQIASTVAALLGYDYRKAFPDAPPPLPDVMAAR